MSKLLFVAYDPSDAEQGAGFAQQLGLPFDLLVLAGTPPTDLGAQRALHAGMGEIPPADGLARGLAQASDGYSHIAAVSSMRTKDVMARLAGLLDAPMVTDAIGLESTTVFRRPVVAGSIIATVEVLALPIVLTIRPAGFSKPQRSGASSLESVTLAGHTRTTRVSTTSRGGSRPDLTQAKVIVSGGKPLRDAATFESVIGGLADALGGAAGATRAAVDSGIAANELQVGQTGKIVAPDLYIAAGISGSTQHMAGIKDSKLIVAINKDPDAPIFQAADIGIVGDLYEVIPAIRAYLGI